MYQLVFYVPTQDADTVKETVFAAGAGRLGDYEQCCWQVEGMGQFRPLAGANPTIGKVNQLETVPELRIEMICDDEDIRAVVAALKKAHPYEEPAYSVWALADIG